MVSVKPTLQPWESPAQYPHGPRARRLVRPPALPRGEDPEKPLWPKESGTTNPTAHVLFLTPA